jgi:PAS domain S-box-containing protein
VPHSFTDLAGLNVSAENFLAAVLEAAAQPICVMDPAGLIRFANPAAVEALGYDVAHELLGRDRHETLHYEHPDGTPYPAYDCPMALPRASGETVASDLDWFFRRDGSMFPVSYVSVPIEMREGRGAVMAFADIEDRLRAEQVLREHDAVLAAREGSLRRIATVVAGGAAPADVFALIAREVGHVIGLPLVAVWRYEPGGTAATVIGAWGERPHPFQAGTRWPLDGPGICARVYETGQPARIDDFADLPGTIAVAARRTGIRACAGAPIVIDGDVWGVMSADSTGGASLADHVESRLAEFTELLATVIANTEARTDLKRLADEQAALRRVATLVARGVPPVEVFAAVTEEVGLLLATGLAGMARFERDETVTVLAAWAAESEREGAHPLVPGPWPLDGGDLASTIARTGRPVRIDDYHGVPGRIAAFLRDELGIASSVASPIVVEDRLWGALFVHSTRTQQPLPRDTESRLTGFTELVATAISNAEARDEVAASRARIVAATDEERRRVVRDLHDGAQARLVHTVITLKLAQQAVQKRDENIPALLTDALDNAEQATAELRDLAHGILPEALTRGGLRAGVEALASRMPGPVDVAVSVGRLPAVVEATAYFVIAEALTNVAKHARAGRAAVRASVEDSSLRIHVRDDGVGGARPDGSGLLGLADRLAVLDGQLRVENPADGGALVAADIPIPASRA